jgi:multimeric flavodoxin WrbA
MPGLTKAQQTFLYIAPFPALAFFKVWASLGRDSHSLLIAACAMFAYCLIVLALAARFDKPTYFDWTICCYFLALTLALALWPETTGEIVTEYAVTGIYLCLFVAAFFPPILGMDPFTYHYAKKSAPKEVWSSPIFLSINRIMTFVWSGIFATCTLLSLYPSVITRAVVPIAMIVGTVLSFNRWFPRYYLKRLGLSLSAYQRGSPLFSANALVSHTDCEPVRCSAVAGLDAPCPNQSLDSMGGNAISSHQSQLNRRSPMKIIAINSSPRGHGASKTGLMLDALVKGMREANAEVETVHLREKVIKNCIGCYTCWTKTPGKCMHKDDMTNELFPKWLEADIAVYATPLYHFTMNAAMKGFIERTLPVMEPFFVQHDGKTTHPLRQTPPQAVVLSVAGFPELTVFAQLSSYVKFLFGKRLAAEIYRPGAEVMTLPELSKASKAILEATAQAGHELVDSSRVSEATMERITKSIIDPDSMAKMTNVFWRSCIREGLTPKEFHQRNLVPRPDSLETFMMIMSWGFNTTSAANLRAVIQFNFSGEVTGGCYFKVSDGKIEAHEGITENPDLTIESPFELWIDIMAGKADGQKMFLEQKYKAIGDLSLLIRMKDLFGRAQQ